MLRRLILTLGFVFAASAALAQNAVLQGGPWTAGHVPMYVGSGSSQPVIQDGGPAGGGAVGTNIGEIGITARGVGTPPYVGQGTGPFGSNWCDYDAPITNAAGYHFLCLTPNASGAYGLLSYGVGGAAAQQDFKFNINGTVFSLTDFGTPTEAIKLPADLATTGSNITLSGDQTIDGTLLSSLNCWATSACRVLVKDQSTLAQNGIYNPKSGAWTRTTDWNTTGQVVQATSILVTQGTHNAGVVYVVTTANPITIGSTSIAFQANYIAPYAGAVPRTNNSKMADIVSVKDFGAVGDGTTNDTAAIAAAVTAATGKALYFPGSTGCYVSDAITLPPLTKFYGDGWGASGLCARANSQSQIVITNSVPVDARNEISGLYFNANGYNGVTGISNTYGQYENFHDLYFFGQKYSIVVAQASMYSIHTIIVQDTAANSHAIPELRITATAPNYTQFGSVFDYKVNGTGSAAAPTDAAIYITRGANIDIKDFYANTLSSGVGVLLDDDTQGVLISDINIVDPGYGIKFEAAGGSSPSFITIEGGLIDQAQTGAIRVDASVYGIFVRHIQITNTVGSYAIYSNSANGIFVTDNIIWVAVNGIFLDTSAANSQISGNNFGDLSGTAIDLSPGLSNIIIGSDNIFTGTVATTIANTPGNNVTYADFLPHLSGVLSLGGTSNVWLNGYFNYLKMYGTSSGVLSVKAPAAAGSNTLTLPAGTTDFSATGGTSQVVKQTGAGGAFTVARLACSDLSDSSTGCSALSGITALTGDVTASGPGSAGATVVNLPTGVTQAGYLLGTEIAAPTTPSAGTVKIWIDSTNARLHDKNPAGTIGTTVVADTGAASNYISAISAAGVISKSRPSCSTLSDSAAGCNNTTGPTVSVCAVHSSTSCSGGFSGSSTTYTTPANVKWIRIRLSGAGGAGAGGTDTATDGAATTFGSLTGNGGSHATLAMNQLGGAGGTASGGDFNQTGQPGGGIMGAVLSIGGIGGSNTLGTGGSPGGSVSGPGSAGINGGGGSGTGGAGGNGGNAGGGAGGYLEKIIANPTGTYSFSIGAGGTPASGSAGGDGIIIIEEHYSY